MMDSEEEEEQLAEYVKRESLVTYEEESKRRNEKSQTENDEQLAWQLCEKMNFADTDCGSSDSYGASSKPPVPRISKLKNNRDRRIILLGMTGCGKSSTGNSIVGRGDVFKTSALASSETSNCQYASAMLQDRDVLVVDTPGLYDTRQNNDETIREITRCVILSAPGPHALIFVVEGGNRATEQTQKCPEIIMDIFDENAFRHMIVLFTRLDDITRNNKNNLDDFVESLPPKMKEVLHRCGNRYVAFNNINESAQMNDAQVNELLHLVDRVVTENGDRWYTNEVFEEFESKLQEKEEELKEKYKMEWRKKLQELRSRDARVEEEQELENFYNINMEEDSLREEIRTEAQKDKKGLGDLLKKGIELIKKGMIGLASIPRKIWSYIFGRDRQGT